MKTLFAALLAFSATTVLIPFFVRLAEKLHLMDQPDARKVHAVPVPRVGGIAITIAVLFSYLVWGLMDNEALSYIVAAMVLCAFAIQDDRLQLSPLWKFIGQSIAALIVMYPGHVLINSFQLNEFHDLPVWFSRVLTFLLIVGFTNAINLSDGLDGLAGGVSLVSIICLMVLAYSSGAQEIFLVCSIYVGALFGFLRFNTYPARIFMGDTGSQLLGFSIATFSLILSQKAELVFAETLPLLILGMPLVDTLSVMALRVAHGVSMFSADKRHIHHRLISIGLSHYTAVGIIYLLQIVFIISAWLLRYSSDMLLIFVFISIAIIINLLIYALQFVNKSDFFSKKYGFLVTKFNLATRNIMRFFARAGHSNISIIIAFSSYLIFLVLNGLSAPSDIRVLSGLLALVIVVGWLLADKFEVSKILIKISLYVTVCLAVFLDSGTVFSHQFKFYFESILFGVLSLLLLIRLLPKDNRPIEISTLDLLILMLALVLPNFQGSGLSKFVAGWMVAKIVILMYSVELLNFDQIRKKWLLVISASTFLLGVLMSLATQ